MATTNLVSKSLNGILVQSGNGSPDHVAQIGSYYTNASSGTIYINSDGTATGWDALKMIGYGEVYIQANATNTSGTASTWASLTGLTWTVGSFNGVTVGTNGIITIPAGRGGRYQIIGSGTISFVATTAIHDLGISINNANPVVGAYSNGGVSATRLDTNITPTYYFDLNANDTIRLKVRPSATGNFLFKHGAIILTKISD